MKNNWGLGLAIAYITFIGSMILVAVHASHQDYDLVSDNYYEQAVKYQDKIDAGRNAVQAKLSITFNEKENTLQLTSDAEIKAGTLQFYKPDRAANDFKLDFNLNPGGKKTIPLQQIAHGIWKVNASWIIADNKSCYTETKIFIPND
jgi:nitrogen fixation protein FixH